MIFAVAGADLVVEAPDSTIRSSSASRSSAAANGCISIYKYLPKMDGQLMQLADGDKGSQQALVLESGSHGDPPAKSVEPLYGRSLKKIGAPWASDPSGHGGQSGALGRRHSGLGAGWPLRSG